MDWCLIFKGMSMVLFRQSEPHCTRLQLQLSGWRS